MMAQGKLGRHERALLRQAQQVARFEGQLRFFAPDDTLDEPNTQGLNAAIGVLAQAAAAVAGSSNPREGFAALESAIEGLRVFVGGVRGMNYFIEGPGDLSTAGSEAVDRLVDALEPSPAKAERARAS